MKITTAISALRAELGMTQSEFAAAIGLASKADVSLFERGLRKPSVSVALRIEELSGGRIDAADLNADVRAARAGAFAHAARVTPDDAAGSPGKIGDVTDAANNSDRTCPHPSGGTGAGAPTGESRIPAPDNFCTGAAA